ncbi:hypothetical protein MNBD_GAMMA24-2616 [hydrothermal vent metagenome]|uniref:Curli production assembly/transport component CsgG n=1 Tax=hydrothermal vent metagenome TaxID=652676 RepID=A0A3B1CCX7_9ZZZZ
MIKNINMRWIGILVSVLILFPAYAMAGDAHTDHSATSQRLENLKSAAGAKPKVTIYQVKSTVPEVSQASATDMFITALVKSHRFLVMERQRLDESVYREKQLNQQGRTTGQVAEKRMTGADYIFVATITEANSDAGSSGFAGTIGGLGLESSGKDAEIGMDVRILDASSGAVIDAVNVSKKVEQSGMSVSGVGSFLSSMVGIDTKGADVNVSRDSKEGVDKALRALMEQAVYELAKRYGGN